MTEVSHVKLPLDECNWTFNDDKSMLIQVMA